MPPKKPDFVEVPEMNYVAVRGKGDPNEPDGAYKKAIGLLYAVSFTIKMSKMGSNKIEGYFDYVVPPLEGLWWQSGTEKIDYSRKENFSWIAMIRLPEFVGKDTFDWAVREVSEKKQMDVSDVFYFTYQEGLCVQCMHIGGYDNEPETMERMEAFTEAGGYEAGLSGGRLHHEIYLSDPRRGKEERLRTVIRTPIKKKDA